jgi:hypothetical protein
MKIQYLMTQLDHSREYLDEVKTVDSQLRQLLEYQNKGNIIRNEAGAIATRKRESPPRVMKKPPKQSMRRKR